MDLEKAIHLVTRSNSEHLTRLKDRHLTGTNTFDGKGFCRGTGDAAGLLGELPRYFFGNIQMDAHARPFANIIPYRRAHWQKLPSATNRQ
jgi:hypothetical protein